MINLSPRTKHFSTCLDVFDDWNLNYHKIAKDTVREIPNRGKTERRARRREGREGRGRNRNVMHVVTNI